MSSGVHHDAVGHQEDLAGERRSTAHGELAARLADVAASQFPQPDGSVRILAQPSDRDAGVISFTGCAVVFADADPAWIAARLPRGDLSAPLSASFLAALGDHLGRRTHSVDMLTCAPAVTGLPGPELELTELTASAAEGTPHPRVARALRHRDDVRAWQTAGGVLIIGRGVASRWETAIEVDPEHRGLGFGTRLAAAARTLVPAGATLWAQIAPANAASVRAFLGAGFRPVGAEALLDTDLRA